MHAEAMLLVDHAQARGRGTRRRSWNSACVPMRMSMRPSASAVKDLLALAPFSRPVRSAMRRPAAAANALIVLRCWRASSSVGAMSAACAPGLDRGRHGEQRHDCLAAADIALQQAKHAVGAGEIGVDLGEARGLARPVSVKGGLGEDGLAELAGSGQRRVRRCACKRCADHGERKLIGEQLVIGEPHPCRCRRARDRRADSGACMRRSASAKLGQAFCSRQAASIHSGKAGSRVERLGDRSCASWCW